MNSTHRIVTDRVPRQISGRLGAAFRGWHQFWFPLATGHSLAGYRICFGFYLLWYWGRYWPVADTLFSSIGVYNTTVLPDMAPGPGLARVIYSVFLAIHIPFILGLFTRVITPLIWAGYVYHWLLQLRTGGAAFDNLNVFFLFLLCFSDLDRVWSITSSLRPPAATRHKVSQFSARLIAIHISFLYSGTGLFKLMMPDWRAGLVLPWTLIGRWATPVGYWIGDLSLPTGVYTIASWMVIIMEIFLPFFLWTRRYRLAACVVGALFHIGIAVTLGITGFLTCIATYVLFWEPEVLKNASERWMAGWRPRKI